MTLLTKILLALLLIIAVVTAGFAYTISKTEPCPSVTPATPNGTVMDAVVLRCYGSPDVVRVEKVTKPAPSHNEVLVKIKAAAVNPLDWHDLRGSPYLMRLSSGLGKPKSGELGVDFAGVIEQVGDQVTQFEVGDEVFGGWGGAFAEYMVMPADRAITKKPANISFAEAAAIPIAAITALQSLQRHSKDLTGQRVLINGASGGVGSYATQIAKTMGAHVSGVCSTRNVPLVRDLGADQVFDYTREDYTKSGQTFDLIIDLVGNHSVSANRSVLNKDGSLVIVGGPKGDWFGPLINPLIAALTNPFVDQELGLILARMKQEDLNSLAEMMAAGSLVSMIDRTYPLEKVADALHYSESGRARGKIIVAID